MGRPFGRGPTTSIIGDNLISLATKHSPPVRAVDLEYGLILVTRPTPRSYPKRDAHRDRNMSEAPVNGCFCFP